MFMLVSGVTISVLVKSIPPSPGCGLGKLAPAPAGIGIGTAVPLGIRTVLMAPIVSCLREMFGRFGVGDLDLVGITTSVGMASVRRHLTSSAVARSRGVCPS